MAKSCNQKAKLLYLERMLWQAGSEKPLSMTEILEKLERRGIHAERKSIYDDMEVLREFGMEVRYKRGNNGGYYLASFHEADADMIEATAVSRVQAAETQVKETSAAQAEEIQTAQAEEIPEASVEEVQTVQEKKTTAEQESEKVPEKASSPHLEVLPEFDEDKGKKIKLLVSADVRAEVIQTLGEHAVYKEKDADNLTVLVHLKENRLLYGWLASFGRKVHIIKPVKTALAYRNYLKEIAKEYKGIEK